MQAGVFCDIEREKGSRDVVCCRIPENPIMLIPIHVVRFVVLSSTFFLGYTTTLLSELATLIRTSSSEPSMEFRISTGS